MITLDDFKKIDLRIALILSAEKVPETDKLLRLKISLGQEKRTLVAGIAQHYQIQDLIGKQIVVVANLKSAIIKNIESQGMLLAAKDDEGNLAFITPDKKIKDGSQVS